MQITTNQNPFPNLDAIAGPPLNTIVAEDPSKLVAAPSMADLPPAGDQKGLQERVKQANEGLRAGDQSLEFRVHEKEGDAKVHLVDTSSQQVLREFPAQNFTQMIDKFQNVSGLNFNVQT